MSRPAARREQLLGHQHGKRRADGAADKTKLKPTLGEAVEVGVIAGPGGVLVRAASGAEPAHHVAVGVEQADLRHGHCGKALLAPAPAAGFPA